MAKVKTKSAAKKRFKKIGNGGVKRSRAYHRHLLTKKSPKRKRRLRQTTVVNKADISRILRMMPY